MIVPLDLGDVPMLEVQDKVDIVGKILVTQKLQQAQAPYTQPGDTWSQSNQPE